MILLILWYFDYIFPHGLVNAYVIFKQIKVFWFFWFFLIFSVHLIQAETGNRIMAMCVHCDKLLAISVSLTLTINDERYNDNFQIIQKFKNSKKIKEFDYFDCFDCFDYFYHFGRCKYILPQWRSVFYWQRFLDLYLIVLITWFLRRLCFLSFLFSKPLWYFHKTGNVRYIDNFQMIQIFKNSKKIKEFDYFDCFDCAIILIIWEVLKTSYLNEDFLTFIWLFSLLDFLVVFAL